MVDNDSFDQVQLLVTVLVLCNHHVIDTVIIDWRGFFNASIVQRILILLVGRERKLVIRVGHVSWHYEAVDLLRNPLHAFVVFQNLVFNIYDILVLMQFQL